ncbi:MAG TPA: phosphoribosylformylglycinamidine cyclo-ligase [Kiritimatiellia bacterium]|nr:phosphoribosylformylglycinamidine cyclo-ligase [Kiritimatiellia bacterium]
MKKRFTYKQAGVDLDLAEQCVRDIGLLQKSTEGRFRLSNAFGQFTANCDLSRYKAPVITATCDGIGTKLDLLLKHDLLETAGADLVAMNVNDVLTSSAEPAMFLDYIAMPLMDRAIVRRLVSGMAEALQSCGCMLGGGELAEMPGTASIELSGFCVGVAEKNDVPDISSIRPGDTVWGIPSDGFHANGFSLIRCILKEHPTLLSRHETAELQKTTRIYYPEVHMFKHQNIPVKGMAHVTGGGIVVNLNRILGEHGAELEIPYWDSPAAQKIISKVEAGEAFRVFNMGIGWLMVNDGTDAPPPAIRLGHVTDDHTVRIKVGS